MVILKSNVNLIVSLRVQDGNLKYDYRYLNLHWKYDDCDW